VWCHDSLCIWVGMYWSVFLLHQIKRIQDTGPNIIVIVSFCFYNFFYYKSLLVIKIKTCKQKAKFSNLRQAHSFIQYSINEE